MELSIVKSELPIRLLGIMKDKRIRPSELAEMTNISKQLISCYINAKCLPKADNLSKIAKALNVSEVYLMGYDTTPKNNEDKEHYELRQDIKEMLLIATTEQLKKVKEYIKDIGVKK